MIFKATYLNCNCNSCMEAAGRNWIKDDDRIWVERKYMVRSDISILVEIKIRPQLRKQITPRIRIRNTTG
jgi:hypothetical protein